MKIKTIVDRAYGTNCYIVCDEQSGICAVIDPAAPDIAEKVRETGLVPKLVLLTHGHFDHISGLDAFLAEYNVPVYIHADDAEMLADGYKNASAVFTAPIVTGVKPKMLIDGDELPLGSLRFNVVHTPGHTRGSVCYFCGEDVFTGDTVFAFDRGRTDLYGGDEQTIVKSIENLKPMLAGKTIYPGHGQSHQIKS